MEPAVEPILAAFRVLSDRSFTCAGHLVETHRDALIVTLKNTLYRLCYVETFDGAFRAQPPDDEADAAILSELRSANNSRTWIQPGWRVECAAESGKVAASRNGVTRWFHPGHFLSSDGPGAEVSQNDSVSIYLPRDSETRQERYYVAFGETVSPEEEGRASLRFYWNVSAEGAPTLMSMLTTQLNHFQVPYQFKCGDCRQMYERIDAAVLYVDRRYYAIVAQIVAAVYPSTAHVLRPATPLFTRQLAPGLAMAEDPPDGESFGASRCMILAETMWSCYERKIETLQERLAEFERQVRSRGLDASRLYLNPGTQEHYEFPVLDPDSDVHAASLGAI